MTKYIIAADITAAFFLLVPIFAMRFIVKKSTKKHNFRVGFHGKLV